MRCATVVVMSSLVWTCCSGEPELSGTPRSVQPPEKTLLYDTARLIAHIEPDAVGELGTRFLAQGERGIQEFVVLTEDEFYSYFLVYDLASGEVVDSIFGREGEDFSSARFEGVTHDGLAKYFSKGLLLTIDLRNLHTSRRDIRSYFLREMSQIDDAYYAIESSVYRERNHVDLYNIEVSTMDTSYIMRMARDPGSGRAAFSAVQEVRFDSRRSLVGFMAYYDFPADRPVSVPFRYDLDRQKLVWRQDYPPDNPSFAVADLVVIDTVVVVRSAWSAIGYHIEDGRELWRWDNDRANSSAWASPMSTFGDLAYWLTDGTEGAAGTYGINAHTGEIDFYAELPIAGGSFQNQRFRDCIIFHSESSGAVARFDPAAGVYTHLLTSPSTKPQTWFNLSGFWVDEVNGTLSLHDNEDLYVYDISDW